MTNEDDRNNFIGGTIAVPTKGTIDGIDISCRSDLTVDLIPEYRQPPSHSRPPTISSRYHQQFSIMNSSDGAPLRETTLERNVTESSHDSFCTAANFRGSDVGHNAGEEEDGEDLVDDLVDDGVDPDLDEQAELAALAWFGEDADRVLDDGPPGKSVLVSENSTIDVSWFAARGLMSQQSFERYQEEMKNKVIQGASSNNLRSLGRRASISMGDLRNKAWPHQKTDERIPSAAVPFKRKFPTPPRKLSRSESPAVHKPRSVDEGLDRLVKSGSVDELVKSIISVIKNGDAQDASLTESRLMKNDDNIPKKNEVDNSMSRLDSDEIKVLTKMIRRLSQEDGEGSFHSDVGDDPSIQDEIVESNTPEECSMGNLVDSSTWDSNPVDLSCGSRNCSRFKSSESLKMGTAIAVESNDRNIANKYVPKRSSSIDLKGTKPFQTRNLGFSSSTVSGKEDSFHTTAFERNETLSSSMFSNSGEETDDGVSVSSSLLYPHRIHTVVNTVMLKGNAVGPLSPQKQTFERSDTASTQSPNSPHELQPDEMEDLQSSTNLAMTQLNRSRSITSVTTSGAVASGLSRENSINTNCTMPHQVIGRSRLSRQFDRGLSTGTDCAVVTTHDELDRFETFNSHNRGLSTGTDCAGVTNHDELGRFEKSNSHSTTFRASNSSPGNKGRSQRRLRRNSLSSHSSGERLIMGINSFSSSFTAPMDQNALEGPPLKENCGDILQEGQEYLSMAMLVNVYSKLRELSMLGHASVKLVDIDVNSHQSLAREKEMKRLGLLESKDKSYLDNTKTAGAVVRTVLDEYEMFEASNELSTTFNRASHAAMVYDASLLSDFKTWVEESRVKHLDSVTEEVIKTLREECAKRQLLLKERSSENSLSTMEHVDVRRSAVLSVARRRRALSGKSDSFLDASWLKQEKTLVADHFGIRSGNPASNSDYDARDGSRRISGGVLTESMIERTLDKSHDYFQEGSSLRNLLESGLEVVWFSDRHPSDIIYCICVNRETATVTVVFRGQESLFDLFKDYAMSRYSNPIVHEDYEGNSEFINIRSAVSDELMRVRRDNKKSTIDEIREKVDKIGKELTGGGLYHLSVTGHSLGGGLATVVGFYLASDPSLELASAVRVFTFATSRVGCKAFQQGFKHLEETGRLQHARFTNSNETVSLFPVWDKYHHVGMQICLHKPNRTGSQLTRQSLDVSYNGNISRLGEAFRFMLSCPSAVKSSRISEYQHRMYFAREYRLALSNGALRFDNKRNHLKSLNGYYLMNCRLSDYMGFEKKKKSISSFLLFFLVSSLVSFEIVLLLKCVATWSF